MIETEVNQFKL